MSRRLQRFRSKSYLYAGKFLHDLPDSRLYLSDGQLAIRVLMGPAFGSLVPRGANDCCLWQRDAHKKKWRRVTALTEDLITSWQVRESAPTLTPASVTNVLREDDRAQLSRQFMPEDQAFAARWVSRLLTDPFGQTVPEVSRYRYEFIAEQVIRVIAPTEPAEHAAHPPGRPVIGFWLRLASLTEGKEEHREPLYLLPGQVKEGHCTSCGAPVVARCATCEQPATNGRNCDTCQPLAASVSRGTRLLGERAAGWQWRPRLNLKRLDMEWHGHCLLSQLFGSYRAGIEELDIGPLLFEGGFVGAIGWDSYGWEYGFTLSPRTPPEERKLAFARLTTAWKQVIVEIRQVSTQTGGAESNGSREIR